MFRSLLIFLYLFNFSGIVLGSQKVSLEFVPELNHQAMVYNILGNDGKFFPSYETDLETIYLDFANGKEIKHPIVFSFPSGKKYQIIGSLGEGSLSTVVKAINLENEKVVALRLPQNASLGDYIEEWVSSHSAMKENGYKVPALYDGIKEVYTEVEFIDIKFSLGDFLERPEEIPLVKREFALKKLKEFFEMKRKYPRFGDNKPANIIFDGIDWRPIDWTTSPDGFKSIGEIDKIDDYFRYTKYQSYKFYLDRKSHSPLVREIANELYPIVDQLEERSIFEFSLKFYQKLPPEIAKLELSKQLLYATELAKLKKLTSAHIQELFIRGVSLEEICRILDIVDFSVNNETADFIIKRFFSITEFPGQDQQMRFLNLAKNKFPIDVWEETYKTFFLDFSIEKFISSFNIANKKQKKDLIQIGLKTIIDSTPETMREMQLKKLYPLILNKDHLLLIKDFAPQFIAPYKAQRGFHQRFNCALNSLLP